MPGTTLNDNQTAIISALIARVERLERAINADKLAPQQAQGLTIDMIEDVVQSDVPMSITCDGSAQDVQLLMASPPPWINGTGTIATAGIYMCGVTIAITTPPTLPGNSVHVLANSFVQDIFQLDLLNQTYGGASREVALFEWIAVSGADLPFETVSAVNTQADATAVLAVTPFVARLLY